jgi:hypothetical protein
MKRKTNNSKDIESKKTKSIQRIAKELVLNGV